MIKTGVSNGLSRGVRTGAPRLFVVGNAWNEKAKDFLLRADATGESRPVAFDSALNALIQGLIDDECFHTQNDLLVNTRGGIGIGPATSKLNLIKNAHNALGVNNPTYVAGTGYKTNGVSSYIDTDYNFGTQAVLYKQNDASFLIKTSGSGLISSGLIITTGIQSCIQIYDKLSRINTSTQSTYTGAISAGYNCLARNNASNYDVYRNLLSENTSSASTPLRNYKCRILALPIDEISWYYSASTVISELYALGAYLTQAKFLKLQSRFNTFWAAVC